VAVLLTLAVITGFAGSLATWVNRQALNTRNWTDTSGRLLADAHIQRALSDYLVQQLPTADLPGPLSTGLRGVAERVVPPLLATDVAQRIWREANRTAHAQFMRIINGGGHAVSTRKGAVTLDLHPLIESLISRIGPLRQLGITLPDNVGRIVIMRSDQLKTAQNIAVGIRGLAITFTIVPLALCALALWVAEGWRRIVLRRIGWCAAGLGVILLIARWLLGDIVVDALVSAPSVHDAGTSVWLIGTSLLRDLAIALIVSGVIVVVASWLAGGTAPARRLRRLTRRSLARDTLR
jgi:hypothetical protein